MAKCACGCDYNGETLRSGAAVDAYARRFGKAPMPGGSTAAQCSALNAIPPRERVAIRAAALGIKDAAQAATFIAVEAQGSVWSLLGPFLFLLWPIVVINVVALVLPYVVLSLLIDCDVTQALKNEAASARRNIGRIRAGSRMPGAMLIPYAAEMLEAANLADIFLREVEAGRFPGPSAWAAALRAMSSSSVPAVRSAAAAALQIDTSIGSPLQKAARQSDRASREASRFAAVANASVPAPSNDALAKAKAERLGRTPSPTSPPASAAGVFTLAGAAALALAFAR